MFKKEKINFVIRTLDELYPTIPIPLDHTVIDIFGVWGPKKFMGREFDGIHRTTFILDENAVISRVIDKVKAKSHAQQILEE